MTMKFKNQKLATEKFQAEKKTLETKFNEVSLELKSKNHQFEDQKLMIEITEAKKVTLKAENKTLETKFNEVSLKLNLKSRQYDCLRKSGENERVSNDSKKPETTSIGTQTIKEEPQEIGVVNVPSPLPGPSNRSQPAKAGKKRTNPGMTEDTKPIQPKRKRSVARKKKP